MNTETKLSGFAKYAWFVLAYNVVVILWGVFLRASKSGDGCGQHWLTCHGEVIPSAPELKTVIEFSHRITSALDGFIVIILLGWATLRYYRNDLPRFATFLKKKLFLIRLVLNLLFDEKGNFRYKHNRFIQILSLSIFSSSVNDNLVMKMAVGSFVFVIVEGLLGAGLVLTGNTAENLTAARPFWMAGHLITTLILLTFLTLTAWFASGGKALNFKTEPKVKLLLLLGVCGFLLVGMSGSVAALSNMIFPSETLTEGITKDFSATSNILLRLRVFHPILSVLTSVYLVFLAGWLRKKAENNESVTRWSNVLSVLVLIQIAFGAITLLTLAPILMQLGHLFLADAVWISFVLLTASFLAERSELEQISV